MSTIINGTSSAITFPDTTVQNTAFTTGAVTQSTIANGVAGTGPAFSAYQSVQQTLSSATATKITFTTVEFDTNSNYASSRFTPTVAGYYQISGGIQVNSSITTISYIVYKNGSPFKNLQLTSTASVTAVSGSVLIYFNGTTDYVELYATIGTGQALGATAVSTYFQGSMVRSA